MDRPSARRLGRWVPGSLFLLLGLIAFAPGPAGAACGDYAGFHPQRTSAASYAAPEALKAEIVDRDGSAPEPALPCSGFSCSKGSRVPTAPAPPPPTSRSNGECWTALASLPTSPDAKGFHDEGTPCFPRRVPSSIERPPRFDASLAS